MKKKEITDLDRLAVRSRPEGAPVMHQDWHKLLFMHWRIPAETLRPLIPERLTIDTFDGSAWVGVTPFTMSNVRPSFVPSLLVPPISGLSQMHELNVRTYVYLDKVPGVWFFSLDTNSGLAVQGARAFFHLPYFNADISMEQKGGSFSYKLSRTEEGSAAAEFKARWKTGETLPYAQPGTLEFFLIERYCLYSARGKKLYRARIHHQPWPLQEAAVSSFSSSMLEADGLPTPAGEPLLHFGEEVNVDIWPPEEI
ncbi:MAG TPA: DUF2071 domain-containing protein [Pyrinomonadaceae bacterium]|jgi:hypothetical protein